MKYIISISILICLVITACSKKEETKLTAFSQEAFAYDLGNGYEVNASTRVKGFEQKNEGEKYSASISYSVDLITPNNDTTKSMFKKTLDKTDNEKIIDLPLEAQFDLDSTSAKGNYKVLYKIEDKNSGQAITTSINFKVE